MPPAFALDHLPPKGDGPPQEGARLGDVAGGQHRPDARAADGLPAVLKGGQHPQSDAHPFAERPQLGYGKGAPAAHGEIGPHP